MIAIPLEFDRYLIPECTPVRIEHVVDGVEDRFLVKVVPPGFLARLIYRFWQHGVIQISIPGSIWQQGCLLARDDNILGLVWINRGDQGYIGLQLTDRTSEDAVIIHYLIQEELENHENIFMKEVIECPTCAETSKGNHESYFDVENLLFSHKHNIKKIACGSCQTIHSIDRLVDVVNITPTDSSEFQQTLQERKSYSTLYTSLKQEIMKELVVNKIVPDDFFHSVAHDIFVELINYKKKVHNNHWKNLMGYTKENQFQDDLINYFNEEGRFPDQTLKESEAGRGRFDILVKGIPVETKLPEERKPLQDYEKQHLNQLEQYCCLRNSKHGFLVIFDKHPQGTDPEPPQTSDFNVTVKKYPGKKTASYLLLMTLIIRAGKKTEPSKLKKDQ